MPNTVKVGKIFGIKIYLDFSWFVIFFLVTLNLVVGLLPVFNPDLSNISYWALGIIASVLFFGSIVAHELAHSLVARMDGLSVSEITLFLFGGVADMEKEPRSPRSEFLISIIGPMTSFILGAVCLALAGVSLSSVPFFLTGTNTNPGASNLNPGQTLLAWLGSANIIISLFNLVPGFPLDGGRVLRSILWSMTNSLHKATLIASSLGQVVGWFFLFTGALLVLGLEVPVLGTGFASGLWLAFIGLFLNNAAFQSYQRAVVKDLLREVTVSQLMKRDWISVSPEALVKKVVDHQELAKEEKVYPVTRGRRVYGLFDWHVVKKPLEKGTKVKQVMVPLGQLVTLNPQEKSGEVLEKLGGPNLYLLVLNGTNLVGLVSRKEIARWLQLKAKKSEASSISWLASDS